MSNGHPLKNSLNVEILAELARRNVVVSVGAPGVYFLDTARVVNRERPDKPPLSCIEISPIDEAPSPNGGRPLSRAFDADQYFLDLVSRGVSAARARRLANLAADVDALAGSLAKEDGK